MKERRWFKFSLIVGLMALLLFNFSCVELKRFVSEEAEERIASLMPEDTTFYFSLNLGQGQAAKFEKLWQVFAAIPGVEEATAELDELMKGLPPEINFEDDVAPWLSMEVGLALPIFKVGKEADLTELSEEQPLILTLASRDTAKSNAFLEKMARQIQKEGKLEMKLYKGIPLFYYEPKSPGGTPAACATYEDFIFLSNDLELLRQVIDIAQGKGKSLAENKDYQALLKTLPAERVGHFYIATGRLSEEILKSAEFPQGSTLKQIYGGQAMAFSLGFIPAGLVIDYATYHDVEKMPSFMREVMRQKPNPHHALEFAPAETIFYLSGQDLGLLWAYMEEIFSQDPGFRKGLQAFEKELGLDLRQDVFSWMKGEYALCLLPDLGGFMGEKDIPLGLLILVEVKDKELAQEKMGKIAGALAEQLGAQLGEVDISRVKMYTFSVPFENITLGYGFIEDFLAIGTSRQVLRQAANAPVHPLKETEELQAALEPLPAYNTGYFYLDIQKTLKLIARIIPPSEREDFQERVMPYVQPFKAFSSASAVMEKEKIMYGRLFFMIK